MALGGQPFWRHKVIYKQFTAIIHDSYPSLIRSLYGINKHVEERARWEEEEGRGKGERRLIVQVRRQHRCQTFGVHHHRFVNLGQVGNPANGFVNGPLSALERKPIGELLSGTEVTFTVVVRNQNEVIPKTDGISPPIASEVDEVPRMHVNAPTLVKSEVVEDKLGSCESPISIVQRDVNTSVREPDDVATFITGDICYESRVTFDPPPLVVAKVGDDELGSREGTIAVVQRDDDSGITESNDVDRAIPGEIRNGGRMLLDSPSSGAVGEVADDGVETRGNALCSSCWGFEVSPNRRTRWGNECIR
jgi:hypothetical protein